MIPSFSMLVDASVVLIKLVLVDWWHWLYSRMIFEDRRRNLLIKSSEVRRRLSNFEVFSEITISIRVALISHDLLRTLFVVSINALYNRYKYGIRYIDSSDED